MPNEKPAGGPPMSKRIWVTWERQRRNRTLSESLDAKLFEVVVDGGPLRRYLGCLATTLRIFLREKPSLIFVQNPSLILAAFAVAYGKLRRLPVVVDAHYAGIRPLDGKKAWANRLAGLIMRFADLTIVTNQGDHRYVGERGGRPFVVPDPMPHLKRAGTVRLRGRNNVLFVCTWANDEPYDHVISAARLLPDDTHVYITGNPKGKQRRFEPMPANVVLTGYVTEEEYVAMLASCDVVVDLTTRDDCLVCGAYEAVAMGKAMVLSGTAALRDYFAGGGLYTDNSVADLAAKITEAIEKKAALMVAARELHEKRREEWLLTKQRLESLLADLDPAKDRARAPRAI